MSLRQQVSSHRFAPASRQPPQHYLENSAQERERRTAAYSWLTTRDTGRQGRPPTRPPAASTASDQPHDRHQQVRTRWAFTHLHILCGLQCSHIQNIEALAPLLLALITAAVPLARADCRRGLLLRLFFFSAAAAELLPVVADAELVRLQLPVAHFSPEAQDSQHRQASRRPRAHVRDFCRV